MTHLIDFDRVVALYDGGERDFRGVQCQGNLISGNLPGIDLNNVTLDGLSLDESDFTGANLSRSKVTGCSLNATNFTNANLSGVEFSKNYRPNESPFQLAISHFETLDRTNLNQESLDVFNLIDANLRLAISQEVVIAIDFMGLTSMHPLEGDKLSGHPHWHQGEEFPNCPNCDRLMDRLIFEFASDDNIRYLWGDCGTGYILQCPECKDRVTFLHQE